MRKRHVLSGICTFFAVLVAGLVAHGAEVSIDRLIGWYELGPDHHILVEPSASEGLYVADFDRNTFGKIEQQNDGTFLLSWYGKEDAQTLSVTLTDDGAVSGLRWTDDGELRAAARRDDYGCRVEETYFQNGDLRFGGTVYLPRSDGPHPGAVFIHGSGASDRDNLWYQSIVHHLVNNGFAVLLPDKRGVGKSEGDWTVASFSDFAGDTIAGVNHLRERAEVDGDRVGIIGISQGGWIAPLAASKSDGIRFVVNVSGTTLTPNEQLIHECMQDLKGGRPDKTVSLQAAKFAAKIAKNRRPIWWEKNGDFDSIPYWKSLPVPGLIVYGEEDETDNVPVQDSVEQIRKEMADGGRVSVKVYPATGHGLRGENGRILPEFLDDLTTWIQEHAG